MESVVIVCRLLTTAVYSTRLRLYETSCAVEDVLRSDFTQVYVIVYTHSVYVFVIFLDSTYGKGKLQALFV